MKVFISTSSFAENDKTPLRILEQAGFEAVHNPHKRRLTKAEITGFLTPDIRGLIAGLEPLDREVLSRSSLKVLSRCGSGLANVDLEAAAELGITVCSTPQAPVESVAELTLCAMLNLLRSFPLMNNMIHEGKWEKKTGMLLTGKTIAIIGFGRIGRRLAALLAPFAPRILAVDMKNEPAPEAAFVTLEKALAEADIITLHASGEGRILGKREFGLMKDGVYVLNAGRGGLADEPALIEALKAGKVKGAWLDTFEHEPYEGGLTRYPQVLLTPHAGSYTEECRLQMECEAADNLIKAFKVKK